jgi:hypothetical protein
MEYTRGVHRKCWSQDLRGLRRRSAAAWITGSNPARSMDVCLLCLSFVLSCVGRGLCDRLITRPEESYRVFNSVWLRNLKGGGQGPIWAVEPLDGWMAIISMSWKTPLTFVHMMCFLRHWTASVWVNEAAICHQYWHLSSQTDGVFCMTE